MRVKVTAPNPGIPTVITKLGTVPRGMERRVRNMMDETGSEISLQQRVNTPVDTGELQANNLYYILSSNKTMDLVIENMTTYAKYVEFGTGFAGSLIPAEYFPPELQWTYGSVTGYRSRPFFYPPILNALHDIQTKILDLNKEAMIDVTSK